MFELVAAGRVVRDVERVVASREFLQEETRQLKDDISTLSSPPSTTKV
jgi:hypothetical protein